MFKSLSKNRIAVLLLCLFVVLGTICPVLQSEHKVFAAEAPERVITIYTSDGNSASSYDFPTATGLDTLVTPAYATGWNITWNSSNTDVAEVNEHGHVLARLTGKYAKKNSGTCTITATLKWNGRISTDSIKVKVKRGMDITGNYFTNSLSNAPLKSNENLQSDDASSADVQTDQNQIAEGLAHDHVEGQMLVIFNDDVKRSEMRKTLGEQDAELKQVTNVGEDGKAALATVESEESLQEAMENLSMDDSVAYVQPNYIYTLDSSETAASDNGEADTDRSGSSLADYEKDPYYDTDYQYFHELMNTKGAWDLLDANGISQTTVVGVVDSGVDADHIDLRDNLILTDGKFKHFTNNTSVMIDYDVVSNGHGTHVAGIIGAIYGNGRGGAGVASGAENNYCRIVPAGVVEKDGTLDSNAVINGISHVVNSGARVVNMSFGSDVKDRAVARCIYNNYHNRGIIFVSSAGNKEREELNFDQKNNTERVECPNFPSDMKEVISVCNINSAGEKHKSSYSGLFKDIAAPGTNIYSTIPYEQNILNPFTYGSLSGTSMAAPMVSGVAALILDANPDLTPEEVRNIICATSYDTEDSYYKSREFGYGRIDARACVEAAYQAREHAQSGASETDQPEVLIKTYFAGQPDPYIVQQYVSTSKIKSLSKVKSLKAEAAKKKIKLSFNKASVVTTTITETTNKYYTGETEVITDENDSYSTSGVKYLIRVKYGGTVRYYKVSAAKKKIGATLSVAPGKDTVRVHLKKYGSSRYKSGKTYYVSVRAYKTIDGELMYGKWSAAKKVKVK